MTALFIILALLAFFIFLFSIPIHVVLSADSTDMDVRVHARVLFVKYSLFPMKKRKKKPKKAQNTKKKASPKPKKQEKTAPKPKPKRDILGLVKLISRLAIAVLRKFPKHFRVRILRYEISVATGDAAKTALLYGAVTGISANLFALLRTATRFRIKRNAPVNVYADFTGEKSRASVALDLSITLWGALHMVMAAGFAFVKAKMNTKEKREASQKEEKTTSEVQNQK